MDSEVWKSCKEAERLDRSGFIQTTPNCKKAKYYRLEIHGNYVHPDECKWCKNIQK